MSEETTVRTECEIDSEVRDRAEQVLLDAGLIAPSVFSALVAMAVLCTLATAPLVRLALARRRSEAISSVSC